MLSIPEEIFLDILLRLPVKSALVCKSVCKYWYGLISNPNFVQTHHNLTIQKNKFSLMIFKFDCNKLRNVICSLIYDPTSLSSNEFHMYGVEVPLGCVEFDERGSWKLMGSSNGLVCIWHRLKKVFCLWNPDSNEYRELPKSPNKPRYENRFTCAFGYDYKSGDYKLICLYDHHEGSLVVHVYTAGPNSWKNTQVLDYKMDKGNESGVLANGFFHWLAYRTNDVVIISLDISDETFKEMQPPEVPIERRRLRWSNVGVVKECLCILAHVGDLEVWVMQDYGVPESWTRHYTITHERIVKDCRLRPVWSFNSDEILFVRCRSYLTYLVLYDPKDGSVRNPNMHVQNQKFLFPGGMSAIILKP